MTNLKTIPISLTIAGSDSGGGAGIQCDLKTFSALGVYGTSAITSLTAQNTCGVKSIYDVSPQFLRDQIESVLTDFNVASIKIGMLHKPEHVDVVADCLRCYKPKYVVLDPVMISKSGAKLLQNEATAALINKLIPLATVLTPNLPEAAALLGKQIRSSREIEWAARELLQFGPHIVVLKGGHLLESADSSDCIVTRDNIDLPLWIHEARLKTKNTHGTGCTFSAAIASYLAHEFTSIEAIIKAKSYITCAIIGAIDSNIGRGYGPVHHFFQHHPRF